MIVSFKHKFIFIAIPKTATHAIRTGLRPLLDSNDWEQCILIEKKSIPIPEIARIGHGHITATQIEKHLPKYTFPEYFSFCFVRNPLDRFISFSTFINRDNKNMQKDPLGTMKASFSNPKLMLHFLMRPQYEYITRHNGEIIISHVSRWENIQSEFDLIRSKVGARPFSLPTVNRSDHTSYKNYYDSELHEMVVKHYARDFEIFDYATEL